MLKIQKWIKILAHVESPRVSVQVGDKLERLTDTQACRLEQITGRHSLPNVAARCSLAIPSDDLCSLIEASFLSGVSERALIEAAATERIDLYVDIAGLELRRQEAAAADDKPPEYNAMTSGYLAITAESCRDISKSGTTRTSSLVLPADVDGARTCLLLRSPLLVNRNALLLRKSQLTQFSAFGQPTAS